MKLFKETFKELSGFKGIDSALRNRTSPVSVTGLSGIHRAQLVYTLENEVKINIVITGSDADARKLCDDINQMAGKQSAVFFPSKELVLTHAEGATALYEQMRISALTKAMTGECTTLVAGIEGVMQPCISPDILQSSIQKISRGGEVDTKQLAKNLTYYGYERCEKVEGGGQFSIRGSIIDIFPVQSDLPVRVELWGDEVDSISYFEPEFQRRTESLESFSISPAREVVYDNGDLADKIEAMLGKLRSKKSETVRERLSGDVRRLRGGEVLRNSDKYYPLVYTKGASVFDFADGLIFFCDYSDIMTTAQNIITQNNEDMKILIEDGQLCKGLDGYYLDLPRIQQIIDSRFQLYLSAFMQGGERIDFRKLISFEAMQTAPWGGEMRQLNEDVKNYAESGYRIILIAGSDKTLPLIRDDIEASGVPCDIADENSSPKTGRVCLMSGCLSGGFEYPENKTALITQAKAMQSIIKKKKRKKGEEIRTLSDISEGDLVVHASHGIGRFAGIRKLEFDDITKDYITIQYAGTDKLYIPVTQLDMVSKYIGPRDDNGVKLNKLSSGEWQKTRNNVRKAVRDMADELIVLYAKREKARGFAFYPDEEIQTDFEKRFPYVETDDQLTCIAEIKADMENIRPMERLLCGDVGFGKTEVAFRAVMKCVLGGKQCALLVPTTVLAMQHYRTASQRFENFPVNIEVLTRHKTPKQQKEILAKLKKGQIDLIIGTHKIIQKGIEFRDLGLAIVDEEQRFGVAHKEKFKEKFTGIDMLTLSATPIPRTLNMAMSGIRDMSVIEEPPQDRHPVQTYVMEYNSGIVAQAISREMKRGGQCFYIHNRVETIVSCAANLQKLLPNARIAYAHGQMAEDEISDTWTRLVNAEIDILVCTTIIETGVDVPNANTLIIEDSDRFGLSQLYQLRGRVGRSNRRGYAYFMFRQDKVLTEVATKRLTAMREFTQFGSGFRIALRDLEIRGAGSILGGKQHGHMEAVGYNMYLKMLSEAVAEAKGETPERVMECLVDIQINAHIPEEYISSLNQRIDIYRKIMLVSKNADKTDLIDELIDRYGEPPESVIGLIDVSLLRNKAAKLGITEITQQNGRMYFYTDNCNVEQVAALSNTYRGKIIFDSTKKPYIAVKTDSTVKAFDLMRDVVELMHRNK